MGYVFGGLTISRINVGTADRVGSQLVELHRRGREGPEERVLDDYVDRSAGELIR